MKKTDCCKAEEFRERDKMKQHKLPKGFLVSGVYSGVKRKRKDLALFYSEVPCKTAAIFTKNKVKAAPLVLAERQLKKNGLISAVIVNSGNANCMTGARGVRDAERMATGTAKALGCSKDAVLVSSTGIIGEFMPIEKICSKVGKLVKKLSKKSLGAAAEGIMTTDRFKKVMTREFIAGGKKITITGVAKGAGMIEPDMTTMLCYILTDADISKSALKKALSSAAMSSFNAITVDGDMSTNDTVMLLANAEAGNKAIKDNGADFEAFQKNLNEVSKELAKMVVRDGEGATKFIEVKVRGAKSLKDAHKAANAIARSMLVKCAVLGEDPNWGRVASSVGSSGVLFNPDKLGIILDGVTFVKNGVFRPTKKKIDSVFKKSDVLIEVNLASGKKSASVFTCDLSKKYIDLNAHYTT